MGFKSILSGIGHFVEKLFTPGALQVEGSIAKIILPGFSALIDGTTNAIIDVENTSIVAGKQSGSSEYKAALVLQKIEDDYNAFATTNGIPIIPAAKKKYVDAAVALLNSFPFPNTVTAAPVTPVPVPAPNTTTSPE